MPQLYDCFPFLNEFDLLEVRLNELNDVVDHFVVVEAAQSYSGIAKSCLLEENYARFEKFHHKMTYLKVEAFPQDISGWARERIQRDKLLEGLTGAAPDDLIMLSDVDEIPDAGTLAEIKKNPPAKGDILCLELRCFAYFINLERREKWLRLGPRIMRRQGISSMQDLRYVRGPADSRYRDFFRAVRASLGMKRLVRRKVIRDAGWHFTWLGGLESVMTKARSIPTHSRMPSNMATEEGAKSAVTGMIQTVGTDYDIVKLDETFPRFMQSNWKAFEKFTVPEDQA